MKEEFEEFEKFEEFEELKSSVFRVLDFGYWILDI